jgi:hypothetical protein
VAVGGSRLWKGSAWYNQGLRLLQSSITAELEVQVQQSFGAT